MRLRETMVVVLLPMLCLIGYFAIGDYLQRGVQQELLYQSAASVSEAELLNDVVHELQKERGYSAGYVSSKGQNFAEKLPAQHIATDQALAALTDALSITQMAAPEELDAFENQLMELARWRVQIVETQTTVPELAKWYTSAINLLLAATTKSASSIDTSSIDALVQAKIFFGRAKESAGLERAMGATGLGAGAFTGAIHTRFVSLGSAQASYLKTAVTAIDRPEFLTALQQDEAAQTIAQMRDVLTHSVHGGTFGNLTAPVWFAASTEWIELLREAELNLGREITTLTHAKMTQLNNDTLQHLVIVLTSVAFAIVFSFFMFERLIRRLRTLTHIMDRFRHGAFESEVPGMDGRSELNTMAKAIQKKKKKTLQMQAENEQIKRADEDALNSKHQKVVELVTQGLDALAHADLSLRFEAPLDSEYDDIRQNFNTSSERLRAVISALADTVSVMTGRAQQMSQASDNLLARSNQQSEIIAGASSSVSKVAHDMQTDLAGLEIADQAAGEARETAEISGQTVKEAVTAMDRISKRSEEIRNMVSMIEELSFQTNLLALNARVEAARAGESGRGFAVVASEVRELAKRSSEAAQEIRTLIKQSGVEIQEGVQLVHRAGDALENMLEGVTTMDAALGDVSVSARKHSTELAEVDKAMTLLRELTDANVTMVGDNRTIGTEIAHSAQHLTKTVDEFTLESSDTKPSDQSHINAAA